MLELLSRSNILVWRKRVVDIARCPAKPEVDQDRTADKIKANRTAHASTQQFEEASQALPVGVRPHGRRARDACAAPAP